MYPHEKGQPAHTAQPYEEEAFYKRNDAGSSSIPSSKATTRPRLALSCLFVSLIVLGTLFRLPHHCLHAVAGSHPPKLLTIDDRVKTILSTTPLIDGHNDLPIQIRLYYNNHINNDSFRGPFETGKTPEHVDLRRLRDGMNGGAFWSVYWGCPNNMTDFSDAIYAPSKPLPATLPNYQLYLYMRGQLCRRPYNRSTW